MEKYLNDITNYIVQLCTIYSPTGFTKKVISCVEGELKVLGVDSEITRKGSLIACLGGEGEPLVLAAHVDTLGGMVRSLKENGRIRMTRLGGYPMNYIETENCVVITREGKEYTGTIQICNASSHVNGNASTVKRDDENMEVVLDVKATQQDDLKQLGIRVGDFICFDARTVVTETGFIKSRHLDDKASAGILLGLAKYIKKENVKLNRKVYLLFTTYEEVGHGGCAGIPKDTVEMISVDMGCVGDDLKTDEYKVSICAKDSGGPYDYDVTTKLILKAEELKLNHAVDIYPFYGSDVEATLSAGYDLKHGLIGPGVYASHGYERTHKEGVLNTALLLKGYIEG